MRWLVVTLLALLVTAPSARAADDFIFNGDVRTILQAPDGSTYIGGDFTAQLRPTGGGLIAATTGSGFPDQADVPFPPVHGSDYAPCATATTAGTSAATSGDGRIRDSQPRPHHQRGSRRPGLAARSRRRGARTHP